MRGNPSGHVLVGEASGANKAGGCLREFLLLPPQWVRGRGSLPRISPAFWGGGSPRGRLVALPTATGIFSETLLATKTPPATP
jgi:hypothetical protein